MAPRTKFLTLPFQHILHRGYESAVPARVALRRLRAGERDQSYLRRPVEYLAHRRPGPRLAAQHGLEAFPHKLPARPMNLEKLVPSASMMRPSLQPSPASDMSPCKRMRASVRTCDRGLP